MKKYKVIYTKYIYHSYSNEPEHNIYISKTLLLPFIPVPGMGIISDIWGEYLNDSVDYDMTKNHYVVKTSGERTKDINGVDKIVKTFTDRGWKIISKQKYKQFWQGKEF